MAGATGRSGRAKVLPDTTSKTFKMLDSDIEFVNQIVTVRGSSFSDVGRDLFHLAVTCGPALARTVRVMRLLLQDAYAQGTLDPALDAEAEAVGLELLELYGNRALGTVHEPQGLEGLAAQTWAASNRQRRTERMRQIEFILAADLRSQGVDVPLPPRTDAEVSAELAEIVSAATAGDV